MRRRLWPVLAPVMCVAVHVIALAAGAQTPTHSRGDSALVHAVDEWVERGLTRYQIAGAALAMVRNGRIVHTRGFGRGDITRAVKVNPDSTVFHIASVTKLLTAIAAVQLVESGALTLTGDVRQSLGTMDVTGWSPHPVTLHHLLTHTAGLDTRWIGMATTTPSRVRSLAEYLARETPPIVDRPGDVVRYSNHGYALIGRRIEQASGLPWAEYVEKRVMQPIGMMQSYAQPRSLSAHHARPYRYRADTLEEPSVYEHAAPGGAARATAADIGRLMVALMDSTSGVPVSANGKRRLLEAQGRIGGMVPGYAYGAFTYPNPYLHAASMGGEVPGFSTRLLMIPELQFGVVLMVNRKDPTLAIAVFDSLLVRLADDRPLSDACARGDSASTGFKRLHSDDGRALAASILGRYRSNVYDRGSFLKIGALVGPTLTVTADTGTSIVVVNPLEDRASRWFPFDRGRWQTRAGECMTMTSVDGAPRLVLTTRFAGPVMLERVRWFNDARFVVSLYGFALFALLSVLALEILRRIRHRSADASTGMRTLIVSLSVGHVLFTTMFAVGLAQLAIVNDDRFAFGIPGWFQVALLLPWLLWAMTTALGIQLLRRSSEGRTPRRVHWAMAASLTLCIVQWSWHMYGA